MFGGGRKEFCCSGSYRPPQSTVRDLGIADGRAGRPWTVPPCRGTLCDRASDHHRCNFAGSFRGRCFEPVPSLDDVISPPHGFERVSITPRGFHSVSNLLSMIVFGRHEFIGLWVPSTVPEPGMGPHWYFLSAAGLYRHSNLVHIGTAARDARETTSGSPGRRAAPFLKTAPGFSVSALAPFFCRPEAAIPPVKPARYPSL
jgi:hypothetical protein